jgi:hypothetical protein
MPTIPKRGHERKWRCGNCATIHHKEYDAERCCRPSVQELWVCNLCKGEFDDKSEIVVHSCIDPIDAAANLVEGSHCLCGALLIAEDYRPSMILGDQVRCPRCRTKVEAGIPAGEAVRQSFVERGIAVR